MRIMIAIIIPVLIPATAVDESCLEFEMPRLGLLLLTGFLEGVGFVGASGSLATVADPGTGTQTG